MRANAHPRLPRPPAVSTAGMVLNKFQKDVAYRIVKEALKAERKFIFNGMAQNLFQKDFATASSRERWRPRGNAWSTALCRTNFRRTWSTGS